MSPRWNWDSPTPLAASECALPPGPKGGGAHSPAAKGVGEPHFQRLEKRLALCLLCAFSSQDVAVYSNMFSLNSIFGLTIGSFIYEELKISIQNLDMNVCLMKVLYYSSFFMVVVSTLGNHNILLKN
jgi:hypothetical protein